MQLVNRTRYSPSIPRRLLRQEPYLLPLYYLARLSDLAREGMENSGSYHFADHIYGGVASGRLGLGTLIDRLLLSLPASRSFRNRYLHSRDRILEWIRSEVRPQYRILSVPCGLPRDLLEVATELRKTHPSRLLVTRFYCLDLDPAVLAEARQMTQAFHNFKFLKGDALDPQVYPRGLDMVTSAGLAEFLDDAALVRFYTAAHQALRDGGQLITSATVRNLLSDYMLTHLAELLTHYRDEESLHSIFARTPFHEVALRRDPVGYQILIAASR